MCFTFKICHLHYFLKSIQSSTSMIQHWLSLVFIIVIVFDFVFASLWLSSTQIEMKLKSVEIQQLVRCLYKTCRTVSDTARVRQSGGHSETLGCNLTHATTDRHAAPGGRLWWRAPTFAYSRKEAQWSVHFTWAALESHGDSNQIEFKSKLNLFAFILFLSWFLYPFSLHLYYLHMSVFSVSVCSLLKVGEGWLRCDLILI